MDKQNITVPARLIPNMSSEIDALDWVGGEPLIGSGFEAEQPEMSFEEGM